MHGACRMPLARAFVSSSALCVLLNMTVSAPLRLAVRPIFHLEACY
jgi:hypothetical protein